MKRIAKRPLFGRRLLPLLAKQARATEHLWKDFAIPDLTYLWLALSALAAGGVNAIAGGGTLVTFPTLLAVVDPVVANATSTIALVPGSLGGAWGYRRQLHATRSWLYVLVGPSILGGIVGTCLVILYPSEFEQLVPWLILTAAVLFLFQPFINKLLRRAPSSAPPDEASSAMPLTGDSSVADSSVESRSPEPASHLRRVAGIALFQFVVALYGGYFGGGIGILMLTGLSLLGLTHIHQMNGLKNVLGFFINGSSCIVWIAAGQVAWHYALPMTLAAIAGGYLGAHFAQKIPATLIRWLVIVIGFGLAGYYFVK